MVEWITPRSTTKRAPRGYLCVGVNPPPTPRASDGCSPHCPPDVASSRTGGDASQGRAGRTALVSPEADPPVSRASLLCVQTERTSSRRVSESSPVRASRRLRPPSPSLSAPHSQADCRASSTMGCAASSHRISLGCVRFSDQSPSPRERRRGRRRRTPSAPRSRDSPSEREHAHCVVDRDSSAPPPLGRCGPDG